MRRTPRLLAVALAALVLAGCVDADVPSADLAATLSEVTPATGDDGEPTVEQVGAVQVDDLTRLLRDAEDLGVFAQVPTGDQAGARLGVQAALLTQLVVREVFAGAADEVDLALPSGEEVDAEVARLVDQVGSEEAYEEALVQQGRGRQAQRLLAELALLQTGLQEELGADGFQEVLGQFEELRIDVAPRFGSWDAQAGVVPATADG